MFIIFLVWQSCQIAHKIRSRVDAAASTYCCVNFAEFAMLLQQLLPMLLLKLVVLRNREFPSPGPTGNFYQNGYFNKDTY